MTMRSILLVVLTVVICNVHRSYSATFTLKNNCPFTIWPATLTGVGAPISTGFVLASQGSTSLDVLPPWSGRLWARFECSNSGRFTCANGDCNSGQITCNGAGAIPPVTIIEYTLAGDGGKDFYDISLVDGFNLPLSVTPDRAGCSTISCPVDINNRGCPSELAVKDTIGGVVGCKSACAAFNQPQYCCTGNFGSPSTCKPTNYSQIFKRQCPQAYSYAYDDASSTFTCPTGANYLITFCP
ncbi:hypothetical protein RD792_014177 [Penstemon davidsonii]|uniref:Thaumatin-like protein n=1 Tax=Penstemon davidsonii TaxID=160366 RepID=A0ABR0CNL1_9LAMI|nr:hypothetical protein RD792_014177 [Penstemon davidsonii]